jgi:iron complex transport system ATP-binding protein
LQGVSFDVPAGELTALIGPNGAGKSTLVHLLLGVRRAERGTIRFGGTNVSAWSRRDLARAVGVVTQAETVAFPLTARAMISMGRYAHLGRWRSECAEDRRAVESAIEQCDVGRFADRDINTLSGGERQRVRIARALAQNPSALVLDEPTAALDVAYEMGTFELLRSLSRRGITVLLVTHNINLAARYADQIVVLEHGTTAAAGAPANVLAPALVERVWRWPVIATPHPGAGRDHGAVQVHPLAPVTDLFADPVIASTIAITSASSLSP